MAMTGQDWETAGWTKTKKESQKSTLEKAKDRAAGRSKLQLAHGAITNKSAHGAGPSNAAKLDADNISTKHAKVDASLSKAIMQARLAKKMSQKQVAEKINEKPQIVQMYESGKTIPNAQIIAKLEKCLGAKLPRPKKPKKVVDDGK